jgi:hypothetical protein
MTSQFKNIIGFGVIGAVRFNLEIVQSYTPPGLEQSLFGNEYKGPALNFKKPGGLNPLELRLVRGIVQSELGAIACFQGKRGNVYNTNFDPETLKGVSSCIDANFQTFEVPSGWNITTTAGGKLNCEPSRYATIPFIRDNALGAQQTFTENGIIETTQNYGPYNSTTDILRPDRVSALNFTPPGVKGTFGFGREQCTDLHNRSTDFWSGMRDSENAGRQRDTTQE